MVLYFNWKIGSIKVNSLISQYEINGKNNKNVIKVDIQKSETIEEVFQKNLASEIKRENLFELIFKKYEGNWMIVVSQISMELCYHNEKMRKSYNTLNGHPFTVNFYYSALGAGSIFRLREICNSNSNMQTEYVHHKYRQFYKELSMEYKKIDKENQ